MDKVFTLNKSKVAYNNWIKIIEINPKQCLNHLYLLFFLYYTDYQQSGNIQKYLNNFKQRLKAKFIELKAILQLIKEIKTNRVICNIYQPNFLTLFLEEEYIFIYNYLASNPNYIFPTQ